MKNRKAVTEKKIEANRANSKSSTGPKTEIGRRISRFNAVTFGLFAKHVVIAICDGDSPEAEFQALINGLHQEFQPVGILEEWLVVKIAESMWRLRRATRAEYGSVKENVLWSTVADGSGMAEGLAHQISLLSEAQAQIRKNGLLSQKTYTEILPQLEKEKLSDMQAAEESLCAETEIHYDTIVSSIRNRKKSLEKLLDASAKIEGDRFLDQMAHNSLPPTDEMDQILRYEERTYKQLDWALRRLMEKQGMRRNQSCTSATASRAR